MTLLARFLVCGICFSWGLLYAGPGIGTAPDMAKAKWVWASAQGIAKGGKVNFFRRAVDLPARPVEATLAITADNGYELHLNGKKVAAELGYSGRFWGSVERFRIERFLKPGRNILAIRGESLGGGAGVVAAVYFGLADGQKIELVTDRSWLVSQKEKTGWQMPDFDASSWRAAAELGPMGMKPWGMLSVPDKLTDPRRLVVDRKKPGELSKELVGRVIPAPEDFAWPGGVAFLQGTVPKQHHFALKVSLGRGRSATLQMRAYPENDVPGPAVLGRKLYVLAPARPGIKPRLLLDAGRGTLGSLAASFDGKTIYFSMAKEGEAFYHIYRIPAEGGQPVALTRGPFHDCDPEPLPDGRIAFSSTRVGSREEYHGNLASSLFVMQADGSNIQPLTFHIVADREPRVTASGSLVMIRSDNFLERAKVETRIHQMLPDGSGGSTCLGNTRSTFSYQRATGVAGAIRPGLLRQNGFGSPSPLPNGAVAALTGQGLVVSGSSRGEGRPVPTSAALFDISPLPDGRLLCTTIDHKWLGVVELDTGRVVGIHKSDKPDLHSVIYVALGPNRLAWHPRAPVPQKRALKWVISIARAFSKRSRSRRT